MPENDVLKALYQLRKAGLDDVQIQLDYARKNGVEFFADYRFNDVHDTLDRPDKPYPLTVDFKHKHPETLFGAWDKLPPYGLWSSLDFESPLVREYVLGELRTIAEKYDIDGLNIDFGREPSFFRTVSYGTDATQSQLDLMTGWMGEVRAMLTDIGKRRGRPILLAVRVPDSVGYCRAVGLDLEKWLEKGFIDLLVTGVNFRFNPWNYSAELAKKYNRPFYASVDHPEFHPINVTSPLTRLSTPTYAGRASCALAAGADGILYFNVMYPSQMKERITPAPCLASSPKIYHFTDRYLYKPERHLKDGSRFMTMPTFHPREPKHWSDTTKHEFVLEYSGEKYNPQDSIVYALAEGRVTPEDGLVVTSNGKEWKFVGRKMTSIVYEVPEGALETGANKVTLQLKPGARAQLSDFGVRSEPNPKKMTLLDLLQSDVKKVDRYFYRADSGVLPGGVWRSSYKQGKAKLIKDGSETLLHLENVDRDIYQGFSIANQREVIGLGNHVIIRCRVRMAAAPQKPEVGFFCFGVSLFNRGSIVPVALYILADNTLVTKFDDTVLKVDDVTKLHDYEFDVNAAAGTVTAKQDGRMLGSFRIPPQPSFDPSCFFGDCAKRIAGAADLAWIEFKRVD